MARQRPTQVIKTVARHHDGGHSRTTWPVSGASAGGDAGDADVPLVSHPSAVPIPGIDMSLKAEIADTATHLQ
ncbi:hypothetical protein GCM10027298_32980 [Epidermidibacterium keratini]